MNKKWSVGAMFIVIILINSCWIWSRQAFSDTQEVIITSDKEEYERGEEVKLELNFEGVIYEWDESGWSVQKWEDNSWKNILIKRRGCPNPPNCEDVNFDEINRCVHALCEAPEWYSLEKGHWRAKWTWDQTEGVIKSYKCRRWEDGEIVEERCIAYEPVSGGKYKIRFEYRLNKDPNDSLNINKVNNKYAEKEIVIK